MTQAAITGDFSTYRHVQGRKVLQLIIEVPAEAAAQVFATLGMPGSGEGVPVALARLVAPVDAAPAIAAPRERRRLGDMSLSQQCAIRCRDEAFQRWLGVTGMDAAAGFVRNECRIASRSELNTNEDAAAKWRALDSEYYAHTVGMR